MRNPNPRPAVTVDAVLPMEEVMAWIKPEFKLIDLCLEVTSYLHRR
jgi:coenzyme PQQ precursor peptide PqqA